MSYAAFLERKQTQSKRMLSCWTCSGQFSRYVSQIARRNFCSKDCLGATKRHGCELFCAWCDEPFYRRFGEQDRNVRVNQFCSNACYRDWRADKRTSYPKDGQRHRHRVVAEAALGRKLTTVEVVHHRDNDKQNCAVSNLVVFPSQSYHARCHFGTMLEREIDFYTLEAVTARERAGHAEKVGMADRRPLYPLHSEIVLGSCSSDRL